MRSGASSPGWSAPAASAVAATPTQTPAATRTSLESRAWSLFRGERIRPFHVLREAGGFDGQAGTAAARHRSSFHVIYGPRNQTSIQKGRDADDDSADRTHR